MFHIKYTVRRFIIPNSYLNVSLLNFRSSYGYWLYNRHRICKQDEMSQVLYSATAGWFWKPKSYLGCQLPQANRGRCTVL